MKQVQIQKSHSKDEIEAALSVIDDVVQSTTGQINSVIAPVRQGFIKRFPVAFALLVTVGVTSMFLGLEQLLGQVQYLHSRPWLMFAIGVAILAITGRLYKKLG